MLPQEMEEQMAKDEEAELLREEVALLGPRNPSRRFSPELKMRIERWARARMEAGASASELDAALDVPWESLGKWMRAAKAVPGADGSPRPQPRLRPVRVVASLPTTASNSLVVRTPNGFSVEGDVETVAALLRRLG